MAEMNGEKVVKYSPVQERLLKVLGDGEYHTKRELREACGDCTVGTFHVHLSLLRKKIHHVNPRLNIVYVSHQKSSMFQMVRMSPATLADLNHS